MELSKPERDALILALDYWIQEMDTRGSERQALYAYRLSERIKNMERDDAVATAGDVDPEAYSDCEADKYDIATPRDEATP
jgi:hypothetical protein